MASSGNLRRLDQVGEQHNSEAGLVLVAGTAPREVHEVVVLQLSPARRERPPVVDSLVLDVLGAEEVGREPPAVGDRADRFVPNLLDEGWCGDPLKEGPYIERRELRR